MTTGIWAIMPLKALDRAKQRLSDLLSPDERRGLVLAMARDVLTALSQAHELDGILIVSRTAEADALAAAFATERFRERPSADLSASLTSAAEYLMREFCARGIMIMPADIPLVTPEEIDTVVQHHEGVTVVPDSDRIGTNCLMLSPADAIPLLFDGNSFQPHLRAAYAAGITPVVLPLSGLELDIDTGTDLLELLSRGPTSQTGIFLNKSGIAARLQSPDNKLSDSTRNLDS